MTKTWQKIPPILFSIFLFLGASSSFAASQLSVNEKNGLPLMHNGGGLLLSTYYEFWGKDNVWAGQSAAFKTVAPFKYSTSGSNKKLDFSLDSVIQKDSDKQLTWTFKLDANRTQKSATGGGITFKLDIAGSGNNLGEPVLLPNNQGWQWGDMQHQGIDVRFEPAVEKVYFERGKKSQIRAFFYDNEIPEGIRRHTMTITLSGDITIEPTLGERFDMENAQNWPKDQFDFQSFPIDLSFLNANEIPAGKHGFIRAQGENLLFEDGTIAKFWGTNITNSSLFNTSKANIKKQAKRLSAMGFNLLRLHQHDTPWVKRNIFGLKSQKDTQHLSKESLDQIDWWIKCLKDEGIYVWLDLHDYRLLKAGDNIFAYDEIEKKKKKKKQKGVGLQGYNYVNQTIKNAMKRFNRDYLTHINTYTKLAYKDDPAIVAILITNENDITHHFGNALLPNKKVPEHSKIYMREVKLFAEQHGFPVKQTGYSWKYGPSKRFLNDLEYRFNEEIINDLRETGVKVPIATTSTWGKNPLSSLPALTTGDIIDVHSYGGVLELENNPLLADGMTSWMAAGQLANKPMSITEWNVSRFPVPDRHISPLLVASKARHQGWDAIMQYAYAQNSLNKVGKPTNWHSHNDPALLASLPAAALLYRQQHVKEASTTYYLAPGSTLFDENISPKTSVAIRTASEKGKLIVAMPATKSLPWLKPSKQPGGSILIGDYRKSVIDPAASSVTSDTKELFRDWEQGIYTINTKLSQAAMGWVGGKTITLADTEFNLKTNNATVAVQSLDGLQLNQSKDILISLATNSLPQKGLKKQKKLPFYSEPVIGTIKITAVDGLQLHYIDNKGAKISVPATRQGHQYIIDLNKLPLVHWLSLSAKK